MVDFVNRPMSQKPYFVYIVRCRDQSLYTGITTNVKRRVKEHNSGQAGAKYTMHHRPVDLVYTEEVASRSAALKREHQIRRLPARKKKQLINDKGYRG